MKEETHWVIKRNRVCKIRSDAKSNKFCVGNVWKPLFQTKVFMARLQLPFISTFHRSSPSRGSHLSTPPQARPLSLSWPFVSFWGQGSLSVFSFWAGSGADEPRRGSGMQRKASKSPGLGTFSS